MANLRSALFAFYNYAQPLLCPELRNAQFAYKETLESRLSRDTLWLDIGCGRRLLPDWIPASEQAQALLVGLPRGIFGIDSNLASLRDNRILKNRVAGDSCGLPFADNSFDLVTANMVVEHVADPDELLREVRRVLKADGIFLFHTPNLRSYATLMATLVPERMKVMLIGFLEGRQEKDVFPALYSMNTPRRIQEVAERNGFRVVELNMTESSAQAVMLGPVVLFELLWIRLLRWRIFRGLRSNIIALLQKNSPSTGCDR